MPDFVAFRDALSYYAFLGHESVDWTSVEKRLHRDMSGALAAKAMLPNSW